MAAEAIAPVASSGRAVDAGGLSALEWMAAIVVSLANLVPIWAFRYFPGQDTANHLYTVETLRVLLEGSAPATLARAFVPALGLNSNMAFPVIMLGLSRLGVPLLVGHRLVLSFYALAFPAAGLFCVRRAAPRSRPLALLLFPLVWNWFVLQGLYNYVLAFAPALVWLGILARDGGRPRPPALVALMFVAVVVYLSHVTIFVALLLVSLIRVASPGDGRGRGGGWPRDLRSARPLALALAPALILALVVTLAGIAGAHPPLEPTVSGWEEYGALSAAGAFFSEFAIRFHSWELAILGPPLIALIAIPILAWLKERSRDRLAPLSSRAPVAPAPRWPLRAALVLTALYFVLPHIVLGSDASPRLRPLIVFCLLCYAGVTCSARARRRLAALALVSGLASVTALSISCVELGRDLDVFTSGMPYVREGARLYPLVFEPRSPSILVKPFLHAWGYYGLARHVVTPYAFAWNDQRFPLRYRDLPAHTAESGLPSDGEDEPYALVQGRLCAAVRRHAPSLSCADVRRQAEERLATLGDSYDYLLTWAAPPDFTDLLARRGYRMLHTQGPLALYVPPPAPP